MTDTGRQSVDRRGHRRHGPRKPDGRPAARMRRAEDRASGPPLRRGHTRSARPRRHRAGQEERERSADGGSWVESALGESRAKPLGPPSRVRGDHARQGWKPDGRDAAPPPYRRLGTQPGSPARRETPLMVSWRRRPTRRQLPAARRSGRVDEPCRSGPACGTTRRQPATAIR
jgi:hypothetical protein